MRISPKSLSPAEALSKAKSKIQARNDERLVAQNAASEEIAEEAVSPHGSIDAGRAQRLLERADALAGRGDMGAAILAARQSLALSPDNVEAHLLHARLLERNRDFGGARAAYEKSVQLASDRADARENLARLTTYLEKSQGAARQFHFDADELFAPGSAEKTPVEKTSAREKPAEVAAPPAAAPPAATASEAVVVAPVSAAPVVAQTPIAAPETDITSLLDESMLPSVLPPVEARLPPTRAQAKQPAAPADERVPAPSAFMAHTATPIETPKAPARDGVAVAPAAPLSAPVGDRRKHNIPVATERRRNTTGATVGGAVAAGAVASAAVAGAVAAPAVAAPAPAVAAPTAVAAPVAAAPAPVAQTARRSVAVPLAPAPLGAASNPFDLDAPATRPAPRTPLALAVPAASAAPLWQQVITRPSFYARTLPLVGVALLSLGFLSWARGRAISQVVAPATNELASAEFAPAPDASAPDASAPDAPATVPGTTLPLPNSSNAAAPGSVPGGDASGFPISNAPIVFQAPPAQNAGAANAPAAGSNSGKAASNVGRSNNGGSGATTRSNNRASNGNRRSGPLPARALPPARPVPNFPGVTLAPAPIPPASVRSTISPVPRGDNGNNIILPRPSIEMPQTAPPRQRVLPPTDNGLNPAGSPGRGYVRVTEGRVGNGVIPSQPSGVARDAERQANDAARNGQNDQAISQLSQAIRADSENAGFRYQQRAMLFLQRGDYNRASDDFQSAISSYQTQISNGNDVESAKRGLSSARSGLTLALAGRRG